MKIERQISGLRRLISQLEKVNLTAKKQKNGDFRMKWGEKLNMMDCPSEEWATMIKSDIENRLKYYKEKAENVIDHLEKNLEQTTLELFGNKPESVL